MYPYLKAIHNHRGSNLGKGNDRQTHYLVINKIIQGVYLVT